MFPPPSPFLSPPPCRPLHPFHFFPRHPPRFGTRRKHVLHPFESRARRPPQHAFNHFRNAQERQPPFQKRRHCNFIRGVQRARQRAALFHRLSCQSQTGNPPIRSLLKIQPLQLGPVQSHLEIRCHALW